MIRTMAVWALFGMAAAACGAAQKAEPLDQQVHRYNDSVRWQRLAQAAQYIPPAERAAFFDERVELEDELRITMYDIRRVEIAEDEARAVVYVEYQWYLDSQGRVHKTTSRQHWEQHGKRWLLTEERRERGEPMPGLPEPAPEPEAVESDASADDLDRAGDPASP
jgi:hypothetical protein